MKFYVLRLVDSLPNAVRQTNQPKPKLISYNDFSSKNRAQKSVPTHYSN
jgi:hypothetical protein